MKGFCLCLAEFHTIAPRAMACLYHALISASHTTPLVKDASVQPTFSTLSITSASHNCISAPLLNLPLSSQVPQASVFLYWSLDFSRVESSVSSAKAAPPATCGPALPRPTGQAGQRLLSVCSFSRVTKRAAGASARQKEPKAEHQGKQVGRLKKPEIVKSKERRPWLFQQHT